MRTAIPKALPLSGVVLPCADLVGLKMESPGSLFPGWHWVRLVIQEYAWCVEGGIKHHSLFSGGLLRARGVTAFHSLGGWSDGSLWEQKSSQTGSSSKITLCASSSAPGRPEWGASSGPWRSHRILQMTNWHIELRCSNRRTWLQMVLIAWSLSLWVPACPCSISVTSGCPAHSRWRHAQNHMPICGSCFPQAFHRTSSPGIRVFFWPLNHPFQIFISPELFTLIPIKNETLIYSWWTCIPTQMLTEFHMYENL